MRYQRLTTRRIRLQPLGGVIPLDHPLHGLGLTVSIAPAEWRPRADISESGGEVQVLLELAGVDEDNVEIRCYEDALVVEGERHMGLPAPDARYLLAEIRRGRFRIELVLPSLVQPEEVTATYERGLLAVRLPKTGGTSR